MKTILTTNLKNKKVYLTSTGSFFVALNGKYFHAEQDGTGDYISVRDYYALRNICIEVTVESDMEVHIQGNK